MRTNIDIDDALMDSALKAGPFKTKKDAVEAGLKLLARQAAYRELLKYRGQLKWEGDEAADWGVADAQPEPMVMEPRPAYQAKASRAAPVMAPQPAPLKAPRRARG